MQTADIKRYLIDWQMEYIQKQIYSLKSISIFNHEEKIVIARLTKRLQATIDNEKAFVGKSSILFCKGINNRFLLGILNSKVLNFYYSKKFENTHMAGGYLRFDIPYLQQLPIPKIDFSNKTQKQQHDNLVNLVEQMLAAKQQQAKATTDKDKNFIANKIQSIDTQIDHVVYQLYNLTPQEIELVAAS